MRTGLLLIVTILLLSAVGFSQCADGISCPNMCSYPGGASCFQCHAVTDGTCLPSDWGGGCNVQTNGCSVGGGGGGGGVQLDRRVHRPAKSSRVPFVETSGYTDNGLANRAWLALVALVRPELSGMSITEKHVLMGVDRAVLPQVVQLSQKEREAVIDAAMSSRLYGSSKGK